MLKALFFDFNGTLLMMEDEVALYRGASSVSGRIGRDLLVPATRAALEWGISSGLLLALVTNATRQMVEVLLPKLDLEKTFHCWVLGEELAVSKPHPMPYQTALNELGLEPSEVIVFEDTRSGITSAVTAGIRTICIDDRAPEAGQIARLMPQESSETVISLLKRLS